ncbi:hypothetical protein Gasu2_00630 [Galdieria sulphuraria]|uniref:Uncharacterized protein n=1 Tax=Galdieria sulphuraria TaxID=130081 RepID=M2Y0B9_GALSU|nr:uncharacterized protein Gasu_33380 [Galdieria sulphuraria]EME29333.1 hypothetical protein Gasu_33380 [Galdieria sulphuraria]GJD05603.1 hypothetical protein Gasu2_00630 [Galdieria sulphuraria]|eukprot:XP_005705853.1 hypothetical protein Gasu_33380 [Galdieria sulphuraria]
MLVTLREKNDFDKVFCFNIEIPIYIENPEKLLINYLREDYELAGIMLGCGATRMSCPLFHSYQLSPPPP